MFKRVISLLLVLTLIIGFIPAMSVKVAAEGFAASDSAVELLKKMEGFAKYPYFDYSQYSVGYGTKCPDEDYARYAKEGITEEEADTLLHKYLEKEESALNNFVINNGLSLTQNQFDALVLFSYNCGTSWLYQPGEFHNAVVSGATGEEFLYAISLWCNAGGNILDGLVRRRLCEANIYLNGVYSTTPPSNYCYVTYNAQGGSVSSRIEAFDSNNEHNPTVYASYNGFSFDGWYTAKTGGEKVTMLTAAVSGRTLYAHWIDTTNNSTETTPTETVPVETTPTETTPTETTPAETTPAETTPTETTPANEIVEITPVTVTATETVNIRSGAGVSNKIVGSLRYGNSTEITATSKVNGYTWGKCSEGWICLYYTNYESVINGTSEKTEEKIEAIIGYVIDTNNLRVRSGAGFAYGAIDYLTLNTKVEITEQKTVDGMTWGKISNGWVSMDYISLSAPETSATDTSEGVVGTVVNSSYLRVRSGAGFSYGVVDTLSGGDKVTISEQKYADGMYWGRIDRGWVSMDYISLESQSSNSTTTNNSTAESTTETTPSASETTGAASSSSVYGTVINSSFLRIRSGAGTDYSIAGYLYAGNRVEITETKSVNGMTWGKISQGWISMDYISLDTEEGGSTNVETITGVVVNCEQLRVRSGAGTDYSIAGYLKQGETVSIGNTTMVGSTKWGNIGWGWISMDYISVGSTSSSETNQSNGSDASENNSGSTGSSTTETSSGNSVSNSETMSGTVTGTDELRVRTGAGFSYGVVGYISRGTVVEISECKNSDGMIWGKISSGWVSLDYIELTQNTTTTGTKIYVVNTEYLNIRSDAGISNPAVSYYSRGEKVEILEEKTVDSVAWGRTSLGWVCMDYLK